MTGVGRRNTAVIEIQVAMQPPGHQVYLSSVNFALKRFGADYSAEAELIWTTNVLWEYQKLVQDRRSKPGSVCYVIGHRFYWLPFLTCVP